MAGSFDLFRRYQRSLLVFVAILAMLAFFVLPPFLQMGSGIGGGDPVVATWKGGEVRESALERAVAMRSVVNRFLVESAAAAGRDPSRLPLFPETEEQVVRTQLLAKEAQSLGMVVSDSAINKFLSQWTNNMVRQEQFDAILSGLRLGPTAVSQHDLFETLRTELAARNLLILFQTGFAGDPPGWRWDYFRRIEQSAVVETVPVIVETLAKETPAPSEQTLRTFFERYKDELPEPRSVEPGFRQQHRVQYEYLVAKQDAFEAAAAKDVTDAEIADYYEKNKLTMFRAKADPAPPATEKSGDGEAAAGTKPAEAKPEQPPAEQKPAEEKPAASKPAEAKPEASKQETSKPQTPPPGSSQRDAAGRRPFATVAFRQPAVEAARAEAKATEAKATEAKSVEAKGAADKAADSAGKPAAGEKDAAPKGEEKPADTAGPVEKAAAEQAAAVKPPESEVEPLEKVRDRIREQLAREKANTRVDAVFTAAAADLTRYAEDQALWQARRETGIAAPRPPDFDAIAKVQGLEAVHSKLIAADEAIADDPIGGSFEFVPDPGSRFGIRQQRWVDQTYGSGAMLLRPVTSRDVQGNRYLSWKTQDQPAFTPSFETAREDVERAWRIVEARGLARKKAEQLAAEAVAGKKSLEALVEGQSDLKATRTGPFTWLAPGSTALGSTPTISQPSGLFMPGEEFMRAVFSLEPEQTAVAFNEPQTVCYCVRMVSLQPPVPELRDRFLAAKNEQGVLAMAAQREFSDAFSTWIDGLEKRHALEWKRQPRMPGRD
jgi:hypothetical protein